MPPVTLEAVREIHDLPLPELLHRAHSAHREHHPENEVQLCTLLSVKTGGCPEDCSYCPQSSHHESPVDAERSLTDAREQQRGLERQAQEAQFQARALANRGAELERAIATALEQQQKKG